MLKHNALFCTNYTAHRKKCAICRQSSASSTRPMAAKQPGPKPTRLMHLGPDAAASVQDAGLWHNRLEEAPRWHMGQHLAVRRWRNRWPVDSTATRMREGKRSPVRTSAPVINRFFSEPLDPHHNRLFSEPPHSPEENTLPVCSIGLELTCILAKTDRMTTTLQLLF